jgi:hypothetical protein
MSLQTAGQPGDLNFQNINTGLDPTLGAAFLTSSDFDPSIPIGPMQQQTGVQPMGGDAVTAIGIV